MLYHCNEKFMKISFGSKKIKNVFESEKELVRSFGLVQAKKITQRVNELLAANSLFDIHCIPSARLHFLAGNYKDKFAIDLKHPFRLLIEADNGDLQNLKTITEIKIIKVEDYH